MVRAGVSQTAFASTLDRLGGPQKNSVPPSRPSALTRPSSASQFTSRTETSLPTGGTVPQGRYTLGTPSPQDLFPGTRTTFVSWSDGGAATHEVDVILDTTITGTSAVSSSACSRRRHSMQRCWR